MRVTAHKVQYHLRLENLNTLFTEKFSHSGKTFDSLGPFGWQFIQVDLSLSLAQTFQLMLGTYI
jgi:hypothetical protein